MTLTADDLVAWGGGLFVRYIALAVDEEVPTGGGGPGPQYGMPYLGAMHSEPPIKYQGAQLTGPRFVGSASRVRINYDDLSAPKRLLETVDVWIDVDKLKVDLRFHVADPPGPEPVVPHVSYTTTWGATDDGIVLLDGVGGADDLAFRVILSEGSIQIPRRLTNPIPQK